MSSNQEQQEQQGQPQMDDSASHPAAQDENMADDTADTAAAADQEVDIDIDEDTTDAVVYDVDDVDGGANAADDDTEDTQPAPHPPQQSTEGDDMDDSSLAFRRPSHVSDMGDDSSIPFQGEEEEGDQSSAPVEAAGTGDVPDGLSTDGVDPAHEQSTPKKPATSLGEHLNASQQEAAGNDDGEESKADEETLFSYSTIQTTQTMMQTDKQVLMVDGRTPEQAAKDAEALMEEDDEESSTGQGVVTDDGVDDEEETTERPMHEHQPNIDDEEDEDFDDAFPGAVQTPAPVEDEYDEDASDEYDSQDEDDDEDSEYEVDMEQPDIDEEAAPAPTWNFMAGFTRAADSSDDDDDLMANRRPSVDDFGNRFDTDDDLDTRSGYGGMSAYSNESSEFLDEHQLAQQQQQTILRERQQRKQQAEEDEEAILYYQSRAACLCYCIIGLIAIFLTTILCFYFLVWKDQTNTVYLDPIESNERYPLRHLPEYTQEAIETNPVSPQALAYTWINGDDQLADYSQEQANNRYALATLYFATGGSNWVDNTHWLSHNTECAWRGYNCGEGRTNEKELAREQGLTSSAAGNGGAMNLVGTARDNDAELDNNGGGRRRHLRAGHEERDLARLGWLQPDDGSVTFAPTQSPVQKVTPVTIPQVSIPQATTATTTVAPTTAPVEPQQGQQANPNLQVGQISVLSEPVPQQEQPEQQEAQVNTEPAPQQDQGPIVTAAATPQQTSATPADLIGQDDPNVAVRKDDESLILQNNKLVGTIPPEISLLTNSLYYLSLDNNAGVRGGIPTQLAELKGLKIIQISRSQVTGRIPKQLTKLSSRLEGLYLHRNRLNGKIPVDFQHMSKLTSLWLHDNQLTSTIPPELFALASTEDNPQLQELEELFLDHNQLTGTLPNPAFYEKDGEEVESQNMGLFAADVAASYAALNYAKHITLDNNQLTGPIPSSLGQYYMLETLTLHNNSLTGRVPVELCGLFLVGKLKRLTIDCHKVECECQCECPTEPEVYVDDRPFYDTSKPDAPPSGPVFESLPPESQDAILNDESSPQALAYNWLYNHPNAGEFGPTAVSRQGDGRLLGASDERMTLEALEREQQKFALVTFFFSTEGEQWERNRNWLSYEVHECDWWSRFANTCSEDQAYESLNLRDNGLNGDLPLELGLLTHLGWMELEDNLDLQGSIPSLLGQLTKLYFLSLKNASLVGPVPSQLGRLTGLKELDLGDNRLTGNIPVEVFDIPNVFKVSMANNTLSGPLPSSLGNWKNVTDLHLNGNSFTGTIPRTIGRLTDMEILWLFDNELTGSVPFEICTMLRDGNLKKVHIDCDKVSCNCGCECGPPDNGPFRRPSFLTPPSLEANTQTFEDFQAYSLPWYSTQAAINSPQAQALFWLGADPNFDEYDIDKRLERFALATLYYSTMGERWNDNTHWLSYDVSDCEWASSLITDNVCGTNGLYQSLNLEENSLFGALPEEIGVFVSLEEMNLSGNTLRGSIPSTIGLLTNLMYFEMDGSELFGDIPSEVGLLTGMTEFYIHNNRIEGSIPTQIGGWTNAQRVWMNGNKLEGELPTSIGLLKDARMIKVSGNDLDGPIPTEIGLMVNLREFDLAGNGFTGRLPEEVVNLASLQELDLTNNDLVGRLPILVELLVGMKELLLSNNTFTGTLSAGIAAMTKLEKINLSLNKFNGTIPEEVGMLPNLVTFDISNNEFVGALPSEVGLMHPITLFDVSGNKLSDDVPAEFWGLTHARKLDLSFNQFGGELPTNIGDLSAAELNLNNNLFRNKIPSEIGKLQNTGIINLSVNQLTGALPTEVGLLGRVGVFDVSGNQGLTGPIPVEMGEMKFLRELRMGGTSFVGQIPPVLGQLDKLVTLSLQNTRLSGSIPDIFGSMPNLRTIELHFNDLTGTVPLSLCQLKETGNLEKISVDCDKVLCFCDCECPVGEPNRGNDGFLTDSEPVYVFNETGWVVGDLYELLPSFAQSNLANPNSAAAQAYLWDLQDSAASSLSTEERLIRYGLATLYYATGGASWNNNTNWLSHVISPCDWFTKSDNTVCNPSGIVDNVDLDLNNLVGSIPEEIGLVAEMWVLSLNTNPQLAGSIPTTIGFFKGAQVLDIHGGGLTGMIPSQIGKMTSLVDVFLMKNKLSGNVPTTIGDIGPSLQKMSLEGNNLNGNLPTQIGKLHGAIALSVRENGLDGEIPTQIGGLASIQFLDLSLNTLTGGIPSQVGLLGSTLTTFLAEYGTLSRQLPSELGLLSNVAQLSLSKNSFAGPLPSTIGLLNSIQTLTLDYNALTGSIPIDLWGCMNTLNLLDLSYNAFGGSLPKEIFMAGTGSTIDAFHVKHNQLTGEIPSEIGMLTSATTIVMSENGFSGPLPSEFGQLSSKLNWLDLSKTGVAGQLPSEIGTMSALIVLLLDDVQELGGTLPDTLGALAAIQELSIVGSQIGGSIPATLGDAKTLTQLYLNDNALTGGIPSELGLLTALKHLWLQKNFIRGNMPQEICNLGLETLVVDCETVTCSDTCGCTCS